jgi:hypothetical protein
LTIAPDLSRPHRIPLAIRNGIVLIGSDAHIWFNEPSTAMRAFVSLCKELKPKIAIMNGDVVDLATISRHPPIGWERRPDVADEIEAAQEQLLAIEKATPRNCELIWTLGNHDARFETRIATVAPQLARVKGVHLRDHFPKWRPCWSTWVNDVVVKHRCKGGTHAAFNNVMHSGMHMVTGHLHSLKVMPFTDYTGTRFGVDTGCLAETDGKFQVDYTEDNPKQWRSGFAVLTFRDGKLMWPEVVHVLGPGKVEFRGEIIKV